MFKESRSRLYWGKMIELSQIGFFDLNDLSFILSLASLSAILPKVVISSQKCIFIQPFYGILTLSLQAISKPLKIFCQLFFDLILRKLLPLPKVEIYSISIRLKFPPFSFITYLQFFSFFLLVTVTVFCPVSYSIDQRIVFESILLWFVRNSITFPQGGLIGLCPRHSVSKTAKNEILKTSILITLYLLININKK